MLYHEEFPFFIRMFDLASDYPRCVDLLRLSMMSIRFLMADGTEILPPQIPQELERMLREDMQPGELGIPLHYVNASRSAFWVAVATPPSAPRHRIPTLGYPVVIGTLGLRPCRIGDPEYAAACAELGFNPDEEATLKRMVVAPEARRRGVGEALLHVSEDFARTQG